MRADAGPAARFGREAAQRLCARVLALGRADATRVTLEATSHAYTRYAANRITTAGVSDDATVSVTSVFGQRLATVSTNRIDDAALEDSVRRSEALARLAPENPEYVGELGPQRYLDAPAAAAGHHGAAAGDDRSQARAEAAAVALEAAAAAGLVAAGFVDGIETTVALATSRGLYAFHRGTGAAHTLTVRSADGSSSGWAGSEAATIDGIDSGALARTAVEKCRGGLERRDLEPGTYTVLLEPTATGMLLLRLLGHLDARAADEGRSFFSKPGGGSRLGEALFDRRVTVASDPVWPGAEVAPFRPTDGLPRRAERWIESGSLLTLPTSRYWARRQGTEARAEPGNLMLSVEGARSRPELVRSIERGVLVTRLWYIRPLNPRAMSYTGITRDGTFLIEDGRIVSAVNGFRFNQSLADLLRNVESAGRPESVVASESSSVGMPVLAPALVVRDFVLSSRSDAV